MKRRERFRRLYHYVEARWALDDIRRRRLKASEIDHVNDPYEWSTVYSDHEESQLALEKTQRAAFERYGLLCFSQRWNNIQMWSHYGDRHKGICLGFDVDAKFTEVVDYRTALLSVGNIMHEDNETRKRNREKYEGIIVTSYRRKYSGWSYEKEVRMHSERKERDEETRQYFVNFDDRLILKEVIAGARFPMSRKPIEDALKGYSEDVKIVKARRSLKRFEIIVDENGFSMEIYYVQCKKCSGEIEIDRKPQQENITTTYNVNWSRTFSCACGERNEYVRDDVKQRFQSDKPT
jgi:hypothetical protein